MVVVAVVVAVGVAVVVGVGVKNFTRHPGRGQGRETDKEDG